MTNLTDISTTLKQCAYNCSGNFTTANLASQSCRMMQISFTSMNSSLQVSTIAVIILHILTSIFAVVINLLIMIALVTKEEMKTAANLILTSMAFSDFLVGLLVQPLATSIQIVDVTGRSSCTLRSISNFVGSLCVGASFATIAMFAFDRCFAVSMPLQYIRYQLYNKYTIAVVTVWVLLTVLVILTNIGVMKYGVFETFMILLLLAAFITVTVCYIKIYIAVTAQRNKITGTGLGAINASVSSTCNDYTRNLRTLESTLVNTMEGNDGKCTINMSLEAPKEDPFFIKNGFGSSVMNLSPNESSFVTNMKRKAGKSTTNIPLGAAQEDPFSIKSEIEVPVKVKANEHPCEVIIRITDDSLAANTTPGNFQARTIERVRRFVKANGGCNHSGARISKHARQKSGTNTVAVLVAGMVLCYLPITILNIVRNQLQLDTVTVTILYQWGNFLIVLNSSVNPVIYCIRVQTIRQAVKQQWRKFINSVFY